MPTQGEWATAIRLGVPGQEYDINGAGFRLSPAFDIASDRKEAENENLSGRMYTRVFRRKEEAYTINVQALTPNAMASLKSLRNATHTDLSFLFAHKWAEYGERYVLPNGGLTVTMDENPMWELDTAYFNLTPAGSTTAVIDGVYNTYSASGAQATAGSIYSSYNRANRAVTLSTSMASGAAVYVNWLYNGALVKIKRMQIKMASSFATNTMRAWDVAIQLVGV